MAASNESNETSSQSTKQSSHSQSANDPHWVQRFEDLLKIKNFDELKSELSKIAAQIQDELNHFHLQDHLSPAAKKRVKELEKRYSDVTTRLSSAQKQFDREFNKSLKVLKSGRNEAQKHFSDLKKRVEAERDRLVKMSSQFLGKSKTKKAPGTKSAKRTAPKKTAARSVKK
jgi:hypothetical protein